MDKKISIIGGDARQIRLAQGLIQNGYDVCLTGFEKENIFDQELFLENDIHTSVSRADIIIFPLPMSFDNITINMPLYNEKIDINDTLKLVQKHQIVLGGMMSDKSHKLCEVYGIYAIDFFARDEIKILNAIPTAEGAIEIAMKELPITIHGCNCLVLGYGKIGKILSKSLLGLGANVTVTARNCSDLAMIKAYGYDRANTNAVRAIIDNYDVVFNTIPYRVLDESLLACVRKDTLIIDLASKPGGVDFEAAKALGIKVIWALSLPGKVAPITAGEIITNTILNIINELEM